MAMPDLAVLEQRLGVRFRDRALLERSLVHRSFLNESGEQPTASNERMEFLGDAIVGLIAAQHLYSLEPPLSEGEMTTVRAALVRGETLARWARSLDLGTYLFMGRGEVSQGGRDRPAILASTFEAVVAAIAIDGGYDRARDFVLGLLAPEAQRIITGRTAKDHKSHLQEILQSSRQVTPIYRVVETVGPDHNRTFFVEVLAEDEALGRGSGRSKQAAEQQAAREALLALGFGR